MITEITRSARIQNVRAKATCNKPHYNYMYVCLCVFVLYVFVSGMGVGELINIITSIHKTHIYSMASVVYIIHFKRIQIHTRVCTFSQSPSGDYLDLISLHKPYKYWRKGCPYFNRFYTHTSWDIHTWTRFNVIAQTNHVCTSARLQHEKFPANVKKINNRGIWCGLIKVYHRKMSLSIIS